MIYPAVLDQFVHRKHNGADYWELLRLPQTEHIVAAIINETEKLVYPDAVTTFDLVHDDWRYGWELQTKAYSTKKPILVERKGDHHLAYRLEAAYLPCTHNIAEKYRLIADIIDLVNPSPNSRPIRVLTSSSRLEELM